MGKFINGDKMYGTDLENLDQLNICYNGYFITMTTDSGAPVVTIGEGDPDNPDYSYCTTLDASSVTTGDIIKQNGTWGDTESTSLNDVLGAVGGVAEAVDVNPNGYITMTRLVFDHGEISPESGYYWANTSSTTPISTVVDYIDAIINENISASDTGDAISYIKDLSGYMTIDSSGNITMDNSLSVGDIIRTGYWIPGTSIGKESLVYTLGNIVDEIDQLTTDVSNLQGQTYTYERTAYTNLRDDQSVSITNDMNNVLAEISNEINRIWSSMGYYIPH